jgi:hypothetical protein
MPITVTAGTIYPKGTASPSRVSGPVAIRNNYPNLEAVAKDLESLSKRINAIVQQLSTVAPTITVNATGFSGTMTFRNAAGTGVSTAVVQDGQILSYTP